MDFSMLGPTWDPTWGHVGHMFCQNGARGFDGAPTAFPSWFGLDYEGFPEGIWARFWRDGGSILEVLQKDVGLD